MSEEIPVRVCVDKETKTAVIQFPVHELSVVNGDELLAWIAKAAKVRDEWRAKGYKCN